MAKMLSLEHRIETDLRSAVVEGRLSPGDRLPTRPQLEQHYGVATQTVQRAMSRLIRDGFIVARGKLGTFVAQRPPHLHRYGLVIGGDPTFPPAFATAKFQTFLYREAVQSHQSGEQTITPYIRVTGGPDSEDLRRLIDDARARRLAGLVFDMPTFLTGNSPLADLLEIPNLPSVAITAHPHHPNLTGIDLPQERAIDLALDYLKSRKHHDVAILSTGFDTQSASQSASHFEQAVADRGMRTRKYWMQGVWPQAARSARNCMHLLMEAKQRPDALIITDDSLVEHATAGLVDAGVSIPRELEVVAHANFPYVTPSQVPAKRVGFDVREVLRTCLDVIDRRNRNEEVPAVVGVPPHLEDEVQLLARTAAAAAAAAAAAELVDPRAHPGAGVPRSL